LTIINFPPRAEKITILIYTFKERVPNVIQNIAKLFKKDCSSWKTRRRGKQINVDYGRIP
jgi:hypothetical protein